jgi:proteasome lid subunit RPN8/RPN11
VIDELERALRSVGAREIAGIVFETPDGDQRVRLGPNLATEPGAVEIPGWWLTAMLQHTDQDGARPVAFFHSHLSTLEHSDTDRAAMSASPLPWIILRLEGGRLIWNDEDSGI